MFFEIAPARFYPVVGVEAAERGGNHDEHHRYEQHSVSDILQSEKFRFEYDRRTLVFRVFESSLSAFGIVFRFVAALFIRSIAADGFDAFVRADEETCSRSLRPAVVPHAAHIGEKSRYGYRAKPGAYERKPEKNEKRHHGIPGDLYSHGITQRDCTQRRHCKREQHNERGRERVKEFLRLFGFLFHACLLIPVFADIIRICLYQVKRRGGGAIYEKRGVLARRSAAYIILRGGVPETTIFAETRQNHPFCAPRTILL